MELTLQWLTETMAGEFTLTMLVSMYYGEVSEQSAPKGKKKKVNAEIN